MGVIREDQKAKLVFKLGDKSERELDCFVKDIQKDRLSLAFPKEALSYAEYLQEGNEVPVKIFTPSGIRVFDAMILNSPLEQDFVIEYVEDSIQIQRRAYARVKLETKLIVERSNGQNIITYTHDIGGGGLRFHYEGDFFPNEQVKCRLYLPKQMTSIVAMGEILKKPHLLKNEFIVLFTDIRESDRDRIIKKCFEVEASLYSE